MKKNKIIVSCILGILVLAVLAILAVTLFGRPAETEEKEPVQEKTKKELILDENGTLLKKGETLQIKVKEGEAAEYSSSNVAVATVDQKGTVTAVSKGNAVITVSGKSGEKAYFGVIVDLGEEGLLDIREKKPNMIVSEQYLEHMSVLRDFVIVHGETYYIQRKDSQPSDLTLQHLDAQGHVDEWMTFSGFGGGVSISAEEGKDGSWYIWLESNGNAASEGQTISRILYEPGKSYQGQGGQTWYFNQTEGAVYASVDTENGLVCVRTVSKGGYTFSYYDYESMIAGGELIPLYQIEMNMLTSNLESSINPSGLAVGSFTFRGFQTKGSYIYQYYGASESTLILAVYNMKGVAQYVHKVDNYKDLTFREPDGMCISDGKVYLGIATGESSNRRANILCYE